MSFDPKYRAREEEKQRILEIQKMEREKMRRKKSTSRKNSKRKTDRSKSNKVDDTHRSAEDTGDSIYHNKVTFKKLENGVDKALLIRVSG